MADAVSWKKLYRIAGGGGGAKFNRVVLNATNVDPDKGYLVKAFDRLVVPKSTLAIKIDPSGLKDDEAFQIYDSGRNFDNNPVLVKANPNLTIADAGQDGSGANLDLSLDMVGAGQVWEFVYSGGVLIASDSPGFTGDGGGGGGSAPANGGGGGAAITVDTSIVENSPNPVSGGAVFTALAKKADIGGGNSNPSTPSAGGLQIATARVEQHNARQTGTVQHPFKANVLVMVMDVGSGQTVAIGGDISGGTIALQNFKDKSFDVIFQASGGPYNLIIVGENA